MKTAKIVLAIALAAGVVASGAAWADRGRGHSHSHSRVVFGINLGMPLGPWYYPPYYYPYPPAPPPYANVVAVQPSPPVYIERGGEPSGPAAPSSGYWYYCPDPQGYHPYVTECRTGWLTVLPQSPGQSGPR